MQLVPPAARTTRSRSGLILALAAAIVLAASLPQQASAASTGASGPTPSSKVACPPRRIISSATCDKVAGVPVSSTAPRTAGALFAETFDQGLRLSSNRQRLTWMPLDYNWQSQPAGTQNERGYEDFAGASWNVNPNRDPGYTPFSVTNGILRITSTRIPPTYLTGPGGVLDQMRTQGQDVTHPPTWMGGMLISDQSFRYGYVEARITFDPAHVGRGMFPGLWLYAAGGSGNAEGKGGAEIDIMEVFGTPTQWASTLHYYVDGTTSVRPSLSVDHPLSVVGTHTWGLDWQPTYLRFYFDGQLIREVTGPDATWFNTPMTVRLNFSMDAPWFGPGRHSDATSPASLWMDVDYVTVSPTRP